MTLQIYFLLTKIFVLYGRVSIFTIFIIIVANKTFIVSYFETLLFHPCVLFELIKHLEAG